MEIIYKTSSKQLLDPDSEVSVREDDDKHICCAFCHHVISHPRFKMDMDGAHCHTFANPHGIVFEIGCFTSAPGCLTAGDPSGEFSWFKGYQWKIAACKGCQAHNGWQFVSGTHQFFGLILDKIV